MTSWRAYFFGMGTTSKLFIQHVYKTGRVSCGSVDGTEAGLCAKLNLFYARIGSLVSWQIEVLKKSELESICVPKWKSEMTLCTIKNFFSFDCLILLVEVKMDMWCIML